MSQILGLLGLLIVGQVLVAQASTTPDQVASFRTLSMITSINDLLYDYDGESVPVKARTSSFSKAYPLPDDGNLIFYRLLPPKEGETEPQRINVAEIELEEDNGGLFIFMTEATDNVNHINTFVAKDSWTEHPLETLLVFNLSERHTMVKLDTDGEVRQLGPGQSAIYPYPKNGSKQAMLKVATREDGSDWELRIGGPQLTLAGTRSTLALVDEQATELRPLTKDLLIRKLIERAPITEE